MTLSSKIFWSTPIEKYSHNLMEFLKLNKNAEVSKFFFINLYCRPPVQFGLKSSILFLIFLNKKILHIYTYICITICLFTHHISFGRHRLRCLSHKTTAGENVEEKPKWKSFVTYFLWFSFSKTHTYEYFYIPSILVCICAKREFKFCKSKIGDVVVLLVAYVCCRCCHFFGFCCRRRICVRFHRHKHTHMFAR